MGATRHFGIEKTRLTFVAFLSALAVAGLASDGPGQPASLPCVGTAHTYGPRCAL